MIKYDKARIEYALNLLNEIEVKGIENCKRVAIIESVLQDFKEDEEKGKED